MGVNVIDAFSVLFLWIPLNWYGLLLYTNFNFIKSDSLRGQQNSNLRLNVRVYAYIL